MKKNTSILIGLFVIVFIAGGFLYIKGSPTKNTQVLSPSEAWATYSNPKMGFSIEYPSSSMKVTPEGAFGTNTVRIDSGNIASSKMIVATLVPTEPKEIVSIDDWVKKVEGTNSPGGSPYTDIQYKTVDGVRVGISRDPNNVSDMQLLYVRNTQLFMISTINLSSGDSSRIIKSVHFLSN